MSITENSIAVGSLKWFYRQAIPNNETEKSPVLLLHGLPSQSFSWCEVMVELADKGFRAIAPDWIGCGYSDKPDRRDFNYTPEGYIQALNDLISALELEKFSLIVQGFLASVGLQYALRYPERIDRLVILNTPLSTATKVPWKMKQWGVPLIGDMLTQDPLLVDRTLEGGSGFVISDQNLDVYRKPFLMSSDVGRALVAIMQNLKFSESMAELETGLPKWEQPTLIIWGCADPWLSVDDAEKLANSPGNVELVRIEKAKHYPQEHWSKEMGETILNFLRRQAL